MTEAQGVPIVTATETTSPATPTAKAVELPVAVAVKGVKSGAKTSEALFTFIIIVLGGLLSSGLIGDMSTLGKAIVFAISALKAMMYTWSRTQVKTAVTALAIVFMFGAVAPSSGCANARTQTIRTTLVTANTMSEAFVIFDARMQASLVHAANGDQAVAEASVSEWRKKRLEAEHYMIAVYKAIATAASLDDDASLQNMLLAIAVLRQQLTAIGVTL